MASVRSGQDRPPSDLATAEERTHFKKKSMVEYENFLQDIQPSSYFDFVIFFRHILQLPKHILVTLHLDEGNCRNHNDDCILRRLSGDPHLKRFSAILFI